MNGVGEKIVMEKTDNYVDVCTDCRYWVFTTEIDDFTCCSHEGCIEADDKNIDMI